MLLAKIGAFLLLCLGAIVALGMIAVACPSLHHTAMTIGETAISWFRIVAVGMFVFAGWITTKI